MFPGVTRSALSALAAAAVAPPEGAIPPELDAIVRRACAGAWRAIEVVLAGDVLRARLSKTRDTIVREAVSGLLDLVGNVGIRADALAALRTARDEGALEGPFDIVATVDDIRVHGAVAVGRGAIADIRRALAAYRELEAALGEHELASLLIDTARACVRGASRDPVLAAWAIGPTGSPGRDRALAAFAELATSPESLDELESLIAPPIHLDENVQFTVYRPRTIDPGKWHQLLAFAHLADRRPGEDDLPDPVEEVRRQAASVLGEKARQYQPVVQDSGSAIPGEGELTFVPEFPGIEVNPPRRSFLWLEPVHREEFRIRAGRELDGKTVRGRLTVFLGHIAIAEVALSVRVDASRPEPRVREPQAARAYRKIFASYSHRDIAIVNQFETYARALGDEYLRDWVHLRTGEVWTDRLCQLISQADAFQLFWSKNSMHSQFVRQEYEYALSLNRPSFVRPTYWEDPMPTAPGLPPESLLRLHFQKLGAETISVGAGSRRADVPSRKRAAKLDDALEMERERSTDVMEVARDTDPNRAIDSWDSSTNPEHDDLDPADSFSDTRNDVRAITAEDGQIEAEYQIPRRPLTQPGAGAPATRRPGGSMPPPAKEESKVRKSMAARPVVAAPATPLPSASRAKAPRFESSPPIDPPAPAPTTSQRAMATRPSAPASIPSAPASMAAPSAPASMSPSAPASMSAARQPSAPAPMMPPRPGPPSAPAPMASGPSAPLPPLPGLPRGPGSSAPPSRPSPMAARPTPAPAPAGSTRPPMMTPIPDPLARPAPMAAQLPPRESWSDGPTDDDARRPTRLAEAQQPSASMQQESWSDGETDPHARRQESWSEVARGPSGAASPDSWTDEESARPAIADPKPSLFPPGPVSRPSQASMRPSEPSSARLFPPEPVDAAAIAPPDPNTTTQPMGARQRNPSQAPQPIPATLPGVRPGDAPVRPTPRPMSPSAPPPIASMASAPMSPPIGSSPTVPSPVIEPSPMQQPSPSMAPSMAPPAPSPWAPPADERPVSPYAPTVQQAAYPAAVDDFKLESPANSGLSAAKQSLGSSAGDVQMMKLPEAPAARGWVLAVVFTLIVIAIVIVLLVV